jgi:hypothetical protein
MPQEITEEEQQLAANPPIEDDLGEDSNAVPADQFDHTPKGADPFDDRGGFEAVLDDDLQGLDLDQPGPDTGEEV